MGVERRRYVSRECSAKETTRLWPHVWQVACRAEELPSTGDFVEYTLGRTCSILVVRDAAGMVRGFHNRCPGRGVQLATGRGNLGDGIRCALHGGAWSLEGTPRPGSTHDGGWRDRATHGADLSPVEVGSWGGFIFVHPSKAKQPLYDFLGPVAAGLAPFELDRMRILRHRTTTIRCNWKVGLDFFNETYRIESVHRRAYSTSASHQWSGRDVTGATPGSFAFAHQLFDTHHLIRSVLTDSAPLGHLGPDPRASAIAILQRLARLSQAHPDDIAYVEQLAEVPTDVPASAFMREVRRQVGHRGGVDYSHIPDADLIAHIDYCIYPNVVGPVSAGNGIIFRLRPEGDDPGSCLLDVISLHRFGRQDPVPTAAHEWYPDWRDHDDWGPTLSQYFPLVEAVQSGLHQRLGGDLRLNRQELPIANHQAFLERVMAENRI